MGKKNTEKDSKSGQDKQKLGKDPDFNVNSPSLQYSTEGFDSTPKKGKELLNEKASKDNK